MKTNGRKNFGLPALGGGAGLRHEHFEQILDQKPPFRWFEIILDDFLETEGYSRECLRAIAQQYQIITHGVCLSIGSTDPLDTEYLLRIKPFLEEVRTPWTSDHLCFTMVDHVNLNDLIPLPFSEETVEHVARRVRVVQDILQKPFLLENVTRYVTVSNREMSEVEFVSQVLEKADCGLLLDITNVFLNAKFHDFDAREYIRSLPLDRIGQIHLAGWEPSEDGTVIDSHDAPVPPEVWDLFQYTIGMIGRTSVLVEWDKELPPVERLLEETQMADRLMDSILTSHAA